MEGIPERFTLSEMAEAFSNDFLKTTGLADYTAKVSKNSVPP